MVKKGTPSTSPRSRMRTMFGWWRVRPISASRKKRSRNSGSSRNAGRGRFSAYTSLPRSTRYTEAMPPRPSGSTMR